MKFHKELELAPLRTNVIYVTNKGEWFTGFARGSVQANTWKVVSVIGAAQFHAHELQAWAVPPEVKL